MSTVPKWADNIIAGCVVIVMLFGFAMIGAAAVSNGRQNKAPATEMVYETTQDVYEMPQNAYKILQEHIGAMYTLKDKDMQARLDRHQTLDIETQAENDQHELETSLPDEPYAPLIAVAQASALPEAEDLQETDMPILGNPELAYTEDELEMLAKTVWGEARGCTPDEWRLVIWTVFQRVDSESSDFRSQNSIEAVLTYPLAFTGYRVSNPVDPDILALVTEEAHAWQYGAEAPTFEPYAATLPYLFFDGDGCHNWYRAEWRP
jgi:spore germination cell wall hydrolase CwlJ-like protein